MRLRTIGFLALASTLAAAAACGGGGGDGLSLEEYFTRMEAISQDADQASSDLEAQFGDEISAAETEEEQLKIAAGYFEDSADQTRAAFDKVKALKPPKDVKKEHAEFVAAADELVKLFDEVVQRARDAETAADFEDLTADLDNPPYTDANDRADAACFALQDIADQNDIDIDLSCGENSAADNGDDGDSGDSDSSVDTADLEDYFAEIEAIFEEADSELDAVGEDLDAAINVATTDREKVDAFIDAFQHSGQTVETALLAMDEVEAPKEAEDAHDAFVDATIGVLQLSADILSDLEEMTTADEIDAYFTERDPELTDATDAGDAACFDLQDIADENGIDVDLNCED